ncbi:hypothetical protein [Bradyrhizobium sp. BR 1433]|uniref:hypothetical protein n=1 Tax=Bradyrhizobium sp. BR 1433 TaxID=3447967 RepID=UPI003EE4A868
MRNLGVVALSAALGGCAGASAIPLAQDNVQITARAAPICGAAGAEKIAVRQAAIETIRRGYDRFIVMNAQAGASYAGSTPVVVQNLGGGVAMASGGTPMFAPNQGLVIKMFKDGDPASANALPARETLGPDWQGQVKKNTINCLR